MMFDEEDENYNFDDLIEEEFVEFGDEDDFYEDDDRGDENG